MIYGPILACAVGSIFCLIPAHNVLQAPSYWYEYHLCVIFGIFPISMCGILLQVNYWAEFRFDKKWCVYCQVCLIGTGVYITCYLFYYFIWTHVLGLIMPLPFSLLITGSIAYPATFIVIWFRYCHVLYCSDMYYIVLSCQVLSCPVIS